MPLLVVVVVCNALPLFPTSRISNKQLIDSRVQIVRNAISMQATTTITTITAITAIMAAGSRQQAINVYTCVLAANVCLFI